MLPNQCTAGSQAEEVAASSDGGEEVDIPPQPVSGPPVSLASIALMEREFALSKTRSPKREA